MRELLIADYSRLYDGRSEDGAELRRRAPVRFATNPSLHAVLMIRAALAGPPALIGIWRRLLRSKHSIDLEPGGEFGPGLVLPHPFGLRLASGVVVGSDVTLYHNVTVGATGEGPAPVIGDRVIVHMNSVISPGAVIGADAVIGARATVEGEIPAGAVVKRGGVVRLPGRREATRPAPPRNPRG